MKNMHSDKSDRKTSSHLKLKSLIFDTGKACFQNFVKKDLIKLCAAYDIPVSSHITNEVLKEKLCSTVTSAEEICNPECLTESDTIKSDISSKRQQETCSDPPHAQVSVPVSESPTPSTSAQSVESQPKPKPKKRQKYKYTSKSKKKTKQMDQAKHITICPLCENVYKEGDDWLACDLCDVWYDRQCANISDSKWDEIEGEDWYCPNCLK